MAASYMRTGSDDVYGAFYCAFCWIAQSHQLFIDDEGEEQVNETVSLGDSAISTHQLTHKSRGAGTLNQLKSKVPQAGHIIHDCRKIV